MTELLDSSELPEQPEGRVTVGAALRYASLVWITSVLLSPVLLSFITGLCKKSFVLFPQPIIFFLRDFEEEKLCFSSSKSLKNRII
jgi:hypothetical protein